MKNVLKIEIQIYINKILKLLKMRMKMKQKSSNIKITI